jgi:hypothetical protein
MGSLAAEIYLIEATRNATDEDLERFLATRKWLEQVEWARFRSLGLYFQLREVLAPRYPQWWVWEARALEVIDPIKT